MAVPPEVQRNIEGFMDQMMANVTDCDYNKSLLYEMAKCRSGHLRFGKKTLQDGKDVVIIIGHKPKAEDSDNYVFSIVVSRQDAKKRRVNSAASSDLLYIFNRYEVRQDLQDAFFANGVVNRLEI